MDFSSNVFRPPHSTSAFSDDTMSHTQMVMACRWGWGSSSPNTTTGTQPPPSFPLSASTSSNNLRAKRFAPCQGRLYHQLLCSHRIRTDLVEDCGTNCLEPYGNSTAMAPAFICNECIQSEASNIWEARKAEHDASYPAMELMTNEQYNQWYQERSQLEAEFSRDRKLYEAELLQKKLRPSNVCCALETSSEEAEFAAELDSLSLSMMAANQASLDHRPAPVQVHAPRGRVSLPSDSSEQLHWGLNSLALDRGSCGVEYSVSNHQAGPHAHMSPSGRDQEVLWRKVRD